MADNPDLQAQHYYGYKSGNNDFVDISAYAINDPTVVANFNFPLPTYWNPDNITNLPVSLSDSSLAIIDGYIYLFGGVNTNKIYSASVNNPATWSDTGATLPTNLSGSSLAIIDGYVYLFGGNNGQQTVGTIFSASISNPLSWTNQGSLLPGALQYSQLGMYNGHIYLFGGYNSSGATNVIYTATTSNPLVWSNTGSTLPQATYGSSLAQINNNWIMYGGNNSSNNSTNYIWSASVNSPTSWGFDGYLPYSTAFNQFITIGNDGYLVGPMAGQTNSTGLTGVLQCKLNSPAVFTDTNQFIPGQVSHSQSAIVYDRIWLFGGSGTSSIFTCSQLLKYNLYDPMIEAYANKTRTTFITVDNTDNPFQALGFAYWRTDYSMSAPPIPPHVPPPLPSTMAPPEVPQPPYL